MEGRGAALGDVEACAEEEEEGRGASVVEAAIAGRGETVQLGLPSILGSTCVSAGAEKEGVDEGGDMAPLAQAIAGNPVLAVDAAHLLCSRHATDCP